MRRDEVFSFLRTHFCSLNLKNETNALASRKKFNTISRKQTPPIQISTQTHMDLLNSAMGTASYSNIEILQRFQSKILRSILNAPLYKNNRRIHEDIQMNTVLSEIKIGTPNASEN
jgi:hypothetical protein